VLFTANFRVVILAPTFSHLKPIAPTKGHNMHEPKYLVTAAVCSLLLSAAVLAVPPKPSPTVITACYNAESGRARIVEATADCERHERYVVWNITGPHGPAGPTGPKGSTGAVGPASETGPAGLLSSN
jgi:hypothetical protein